MEEENAYGLGHFLLITLSPSTHQWSELGFLRGLVELKGTWEIITLSLKFYTLENEDCRWETAY